MTASKLPVHRAQPLWPVGAIISAGFLPLNLLPFMVVGLTEGLKLSAIDAGLLGTIELSGAVAGSLCVTPLVSFVSRTRIAIAAMVLGSLLNLLACAYASLSGLGIALFLGGAACGAAMAAGNAMSASAADPSRFYMRVLALQSAFSTVVWSAMPYLLSYAGHKGVFVGTAILLACLALFAALTCRPDVPVRQVVLAAPTGPRPGIALGLAAIVLAGVFFFCVRDGVAWTLTERIANDLKLSDSQQTVLYAAIGIVGMLGLLVWAKINHSGHRVTPVVVSVVLVSLCTTGLIVSPNAPIFFACTVPWAAVQFVALSYLTGLAADVDPSGRVSAAAGAAFQCSYAVAPLLATATFARWGYGAVGVLSLLLATLSTGAAWWTATRLQRNLPAPAAVA
jgi:predicted MFS family arabinose efflux permease